MFYKTTSEEVIRHLKIVRWKDWLKKMLKKDYLKMDNELEEKSKTPTWKLFIESFKDPLVIILLVAALVQVFLGEVVESVIIFSVLILNSILGVVQTQESRRFFSKFK